MVSGTQNLEPRHIHKSGSQFEVVGRSIFTGPGWWVVDFGIPVYTAYSTKRPHKTVPYQAGVFVEGSVYIGIDWYNYHERLSRSEGAPALIFDWRVDRIEMQTAPFIEVGEPRQYFMRDPERMGWRDLGETRAWKDDNGQADYLLHCTRLSDTPRRSINR